MSDKKCKIPSRMKAQHPAENEANVKDLFSNEHSLEMEWDLLNTNLVAEDISDNDDNIVPKRAVISTPDSTESSHNSITTKSNTENKAKSVEKIKSANKKPILSPIVNSIRDFFSQKYIALSQKILGFVLKNLPKDFGVRTKKFYGLVAVLVGWVYQAFKAICKMIWTLVNKLCSYVVMLVCWVYRAFKAICKMIWTLVNKLCSYVVMLVCWVYRVFKASCRRVGNLAKRCGYITKVFVMHMTHVFITAKNSLARQSGTAILLMGFGLLFFQKLSENIPNSILPLTHLSAAGTLDIAGSSSLPVKSDSTFENSIFTTSYRIEKRVKKGNTLVNVLNNANIENDKHRSIMLRSMRQIFNPSSVFVGQKVILDVVGGYSPHIPVHVQSMEIIINAEKSVVVSWDSSKNEYITKMLYYPLKPLVKRANGTINFNMYSAMEKQGVKHEAVVDFINLFSFDVDFQRDIRKGDTFDIGYKEFVSTDGVYVRSGDIYVAELSLQGKRRRYYQFTTKDGRIGYYDWLGRSGRKSLMKTPIKGARMSSGFGDRLHPILGYTKFHNGTDFAAPKGTPIFAAGDGVVEYAGRKGINGIYVRIRHNGVYKTAYAHLSGIANGVRTGKRVKQGKVIGYVGTTGRSTGNHLHYSVFKKGKPIDSRRMKLPSGVSLKGTDLVAFKKAIKPLMKDGQ